MVRYLWENERSAIRELYEQTFQDSAGFVEYYFREYVAKGTRCVVYEQDAYDAGDCNDVTEALQAAGVTEDGQIRNQEILAMISIHEKEWYCKDETGGYQKLPVWYLYGVATVPCERRKGRMQALIERIIEDAKGEWIPFLYLIPVDERIYEKVGFRLVRPKREVEVEVENVFDIEDGLENVKKCNNDADFDGFVVRKLDVQDADAFVYCDEQYFKQQEVDAFLVKDADYFREYMTQLAIDGGAIYGMQESGELIGYIAGSVEEDTFSAIAYVDLECRGFTSLAPYVGRKLGVSRVKLTEHPVMIYEVLKGCCVMSTNGVMDSAETDLSVGNWIGSLECIGPMDEV